VVRYLTPRGERRAENERLLAGGLDVGGEPHRDETEIMRGRERRHHAPLSAAASGVSVAPPTPGGRRPAAPSQRSRTVSARAPGHAAGVIGVRSA